METNKCLSLDFDFYKEALLNFCYTYAIEHNKNTEKYKEFTIEELEDEVSRIKEIMSITWTAFLVGSIFTEYYNDAERYNDEDYSKCIIGLNDFVNFVLPELYDEYDGDY